MQPEIGGAVAIAKEVDVAGGEVVRPRGRRRDQLDAGAVLELHVVVAQAIRMGPAGLQRESEASIRLGSLVEILHRGRYVIDADDRRPGLGLGGPTRPRQGSSGKERQEEPA